MRHLLLISALLLGAACLATAQSYPSQSQPNSGTTSAGQSNTGNMHTVEGCLSGSEGNYMLTSKDGTMYQLSGNTSKLSAHVGHEMKVTGSVTAASASAGGESANTMGHAGTAQHMLDVSSYKHISKTCENSGMSH
jgi:hypothetical protein